MLASFFSKEVRKVSGAFKTPNYRLQTWFLEGNQHHLKKTWSSLSYVQHSWCDMMCGFPRFSGFVTCLFGLSGKADGNLGSIVFFSVLKGRKCVLQAAELNKEYENLVVDWIWPPGTMIKEGKSSLHSMKTLDFLSFLASATAFSNQRHFLVCFVFDDLTVWQVVKLWFNFLACTRLHVMKHFFLFKTKQVMNDFGLRPNRFLLEKWLFYAFIAPFFPVAGMSSNISIPFFVAIGTSK